MATSSRWFRDAFASQKNWLSINTNPEISSPLTLQLHYFLAPCLAIKNYKKRNKNRTSTHVNILKENRIWKNMYAAICSICCTNDCGDFVAFFDDEGWIVEGAFCLLWRYPAMAERREKPRGWNIGQTEPPPPHQVRLQLRGERGLRNLQQSSFSSGKKYTFIWRHISRIYDQILKYIYFQTFTDKQHQSWMIFQ